MRVSHVIATMRRGSQLEEALASAIAELPADGEIIVVDGDPDRSAAPVVNRYVDAGMRYLPSRPGLPVQRNLGLDAAHGEVVVFTDDDCVLRPGFFAALLAAYADRSIVGATGRVVEPPDGRIGSPSSSKLRRLVLGG